MDLVLRNVREAQLPFLQELAKALGISIEKRSRRTEDESEKIDAAIERIENGTAELHELDWEAFRKMTHGE